LRRQALLRSVGHGRALHHPDVAIGNNKPAAGPRLGPGEELFPARLDPESETAR
jgi:hypothetical protein